MPSVASPSVQAAIAAAVERDRKTYGGREPLPAVLVGVWDGRGGSFVHAFGYADVAKKVPLTAEDHFRIGSNTKTFVVSVMAGWFGYTGALPGYNTADYYNPATDTTIVAWTTYQAQQPREGVASVIFRDIARIVTPGNIPMVYTAADLKAAAP